MIFHYFYLFFSTTATLIRFSHVFCGFRDENVRLIREAQICLAVPFGTGTYFLLNPNNEDFEISFDKCPLRLARVCDLCLVSLMDHYRKERAFYLLFPSSRRDAIFFFSYYGHLLFNSETRAIPGRGTGFFDICRFKLLISVGRSVILCVFIRFADTTASIYGRNILIRDPLHKVVGPNRNEPVERSFSFSFALSATKRFCSGTSN